MEYKSHFKVRGYTIGFLFFVALTLISYFTILNRWLTGFTADAFVLCLGIIQSVVQLALFLDLAVEPKPRNNLFTFALMVLILLIIILGTLWIMYSLNERTMTMPMEGM